MTLKVGDKVKLLYRGFMGCREGTIVKISSIEPNETYHFIHDKTKYTIAECDVESKKSNKEVVQFT
jgi:hypothetical protein